MMDVNATVPIGDVTLDLRQSIEQAITDVIPAEHTAAIIAVANLDGFSATFAAKIGTHWQIDAELERKWSGQISGSVKILGSW